MTVRLFIPSIEISNPLLRSTYEQGKDLFEGLQPSIADGLTAGFEAIKEIEDLKNRVCKAEKNYQHLFPKAIITEKEKFLEEYRHFEVLELQLQFLCERMNRAIAFLEQPNRNHVYTRLLKKEASLDAELKKCDDAFSKYAAQLKLSLSNITSEKNKFHTALNKYELTSALERFCNIADKQAPEPAPLRTQRKPSHVPPLALPPTTDYLARLRAERRASHSSSWEDVLLSSLRSQSPLTKPQRPSPHVQLQTNYSSPRILGVSPRALTSLSSGSTPRTRIYTSSTVPYEPNWKRKKNPSVRFSLPNPLKKGTYHQEGSTGISENRRHSLLHPFKKTYAVVDAAQGSDSRY